MFVRIEKYETGGRSCSMKIPPIDDFRTHNTTNIPTNNINNTNHSYKCENVAPKRTKRNTEKMDTIIIEMKTFQQLSQKGIENV
jgi:hypothetical protein